MQTEKKNTDIIARQSESDLQSDLHRSEDLARQSDLHRSEDLARQSDLHRSEDLARQSDLDYKVFVFDLDNTLYLHNVDAMQRKIYNEQVKVFLENLKSSGKILCIATHNKNPTIYLDALKITSLFHHIILEKKNVSPWFNTIHDYTGKDEMINELMSEIGCTKKEIIFFDDSVYNIDKVKSIGVDSILVSEKTGIDFNDLGKRIFLQKDDCLR
jgi:HAD superfamily phosphatase (TIGR01681 family)